MNRLITCVLCTFGIILRWLCFNSATIGTFLAKRPELITPLNSWKRLTEGAFLYRQGRALYDGDVFHELPLMLWFIDYVSTNWPQIINWMFIAIDLLSCFALKSSVKSYVESKKKIERVEAKQNADGVESITLTENCFGIDDWVFLAYLFNPYQIAACGARTTTVFHNFFIANFLQAMCSGSHKCFIWLALACYESFYPIVLLPAHTLYHTYMNVTPNSSKKCLIRAIIIDSSLVITAWVGLIMLSNWLTGSFDFLAGTYGFMLTVPDLSPNLGVFWYFFTEMFDHFRTFFVWVFQMNVFVYVVPLSITLRKEPMLLAHLLLILTTVFKSYPSIADSSISFALLPVWQFLFKYLRHGLTATCALVCCCALAPTMWYLWIYAGSANANFYFAVALTYSASQIFIFTDLLYAYLRQRLHLKNGLKPLINGKEAKAVLE